jgi:hypothetical protein
MQPRHAHHGRPPDVGTIKVWLTNRRPKEWADKQVLQLDATGQLRRLMQYIANKPAKGVRK